MVLLDDISAFPMHTAISRTGPAWSGRGSIPTTTVARVSATTTYPIQVIATLVTSLGGGLQSTLGNTLGLLSPTSARGSSNATVSLSMTRKSWVGSGMRRALRFHTGGLIATAAVALLIAFVLAPPWLSGQTVALAVTLAALAFVAHLAPIAVAAKRSIILHTSVQVVALLTLPPGEAALICALATALGNVYRGRHWLNSLFNAAQVALTVVSAGAVYRLLAPLAPVGFAGQIATLAAMAASERLIDVLAEPFSIQGSGITTGASAGIALALRGDAAISPSELLRRADIALYRAKGAPRSPLVTGRRGRK